MLGVGQPRAVFIVEEKHDAEITRNLELSQSQGKEMSHQLAAVIPDLNRWAEPSLHSLTHATGSA
jgi:hypothetical protein